MPHALLVVAHAAQQAPAVTATNTAAWLTFTGVLLVALIAAATAQWRLRAQLRHERELHDLGELRGVLDEAAAIQRGGAEPVPRPSVGGRCCACARRVAGKPRAMSARMHCAVALTVVASLAGPVAVAAAQTGSETACPNGALPVINGTSAGDTLTGTAGPENILAGDGDDVAGALQGDDCVIGGAGYDVLAGGDGNDTVFGNDGPDDLSGGSGDDRVGGGEGFDFVSGGLGDDELQGGAGPDDINGGRGADVMRGSDGEDWMSGGLGADRLSGGDDDDELSGGRGNDRLSGGDGDDELSGGLGDDRVFGGDGDDTIDGGDGNNVVSAGAGRDIIDVANVNRDRVRCGAGRDSVRANQDDRVASDCEVVYRLQLTRR